MDEHNHNHHNCQRQEDHNHDHNHSDSNETNNNDHVDRTREVDKRSESADGCGAKTTGHDHSHHHDDAHNEEHLDQQDHHQHHQHDHSSCSSKHGTTAEQTTVTAGCHNSTETKKKTCCAKKGGCQSGETIQAVSSRGGSAQPVHTHEHSHEPTGSQSDHHGHQHAHDHHHGHHHGHNHGHETLAPTELHEKSAFCLAVVRESGTDVVIFDASGEPRTFHYTSGDVRTLCFKTHGVDGDLLTPCFDEEGKHGVPQEDCFCGVQTPHLHAHLFNPTTCGQDDDCEKQPAIVKTDAVSNRIEHLASQILLPSTAPQGQETDRSLINIAVSEGMPKECTSEKLATNGIDWKGRRSRKKEWRRLQKIQHDDHFDYLVHDTKAGTLHLEHPCNTCGNDDVHGSFEAMGRRSLRRPRGRNITLQFFQAATRPFSALEFLHAAFDLNSDRVRAATVVESMDWHGDHRGGFASYHDDSVFPSHPATSPIGVSRDVSSTLTCNGICCTSETPIVQGILSQLPGVSKVLINVPLKQVIVSHDPKQISALELEGALNREQMDAKITRDGAEVLDSTAAGKIGRSQFYVKHICCSSEVPAITKIIEPMKGVKAVSINITTKVVYVDHDLSIVTAMEINDALNREQFGAEIRVDATTTASHGFFIRSVLTWNEQTKSPSTEVLTKFLQGFDSTQIESFFVDVRKRMITVFHNPFGMAPSQIAKYLMEETGLEVSLLLDEKHNDQLSGSSAPSTAGAIPYPKTAVIFSGLFWFISMFHLIGGVWSFLKYAALIAVILGLPSIGRKAYRTLLRFQFDTNCLMLLASVGAVALQDYSEAAAVVFLFAISEWLEVRATSRARDALAAIVHLRPETANLVHPTTKELIVVPASVVPVGSIVCIKTGDKVPCDGVVIEGNSTVDESSLTGESRPVKKSATDAVSGGTVNSGFSQLIVRTTALSENSAVSRLIRLVEEAQANRSETEKLVDELARWYTPTVVLCALLMCTVPWAFGREVGREWTFNGLVLIVVACPCALVISTPVSYVAGLAATAQRGILVKGGATLEALSAVKNICFDKTGTLTNGNFIIVHLKMYSERLSRTEIMQYLMLMEERASHPVANAFMATARNERIAIPEDMTVEEHKILAGEGLEGTINGLKVFVGNDRLFERLGLLDALDHSIISEIDSWKALGGTIGFMSVEGHGIVCAYCAADSVREESAAVVGRLRKEGFHLFMLTGDNRDAALAIGSQVGLSDNQIRFNLLPDEKLRFVQDLSVFGEVRNSISSSHTSDANDYTESSKLLPQGSSGSLQEVDTDAIGKSFSLSFCGSRELTIMCGDGVNDAPALAVANVGVAMGAGAALAMETSDITLLDSNLEKLEYSLLMGKRVTRKIRQNVVFSFMVKLVVLGFAFAGMTSLWAAIGSDVGAMILVTINSMTLLPKREPSRANEQKEENV